MQEGLILVEKRVNELMNVLSCLYCCSSSLRYRRASFPEVFGAVWVMLHSKEHIPMLGWAHLCLASQVHQGKGENIKQEEH